MTEHNYLLITVFGYKELAVKKLLPKTQQVRIPRYYNELKKVSKSKLIDINQLIRNKNKYIYTSSISHFRLHNPPGNLPSGHYKNVFYLI
jgi:hypothetical protein